MNQHDNDEPIDALHTDLEDQHDEDETQQVEQDLDETQDLEGLDPLQVIAGEILDRVDAYYGKTHESDRDWLSGILDRVVEQAALRSQWAGNDSRLDQVNADLQAGVGQTLPEQFPVVILSGPSSSGKTRLAKLLGATCEVEYPGHCIGRTRFYKFADRVKTLLADGKRVVITGSEDPRHHPTFYLRDAVGEDLGYTSFALEEWE